MLAEVLTAQQSKVLPVRVFAFARQRFSYASMFYKFPRSIAANARVNGVAAKLDHYQRCLPSNLCKHFHTLKYPKPLLHLHCVSRGADFTTVQSFFYLSELLSSCVSDFLMPVCFTNFTEASLLTFMHEKWRDWNRFSVRVAEVS